MSSQLCAGTSRPTTTKAVILLTSDALSVSDTANAVFRAASAINLAGEKTSPASPMFRPPGGREAARAEPTRPGHQSPNGKGLC